MRHKIYPTALTILLCLTLSGGPLVLSAPEEGTKKPGSMIIPMEARVHDFGLVQPGKPLFHVFTVRNEGDTQLEITRVSPT